MGASHRRPLSGFTRSIPQRIYLLAAERLGVKPEECLFVGDGDSEELSGAEAVGMYAVLLNNPEPTEHPVAEEQETWKGPVISNIKGIIELLEKKTT